MGPLPFAVLWVAWMIYWGVAARSARARERVETAASRRSHTVPLLIGAALTGWPFAPGSVAAFRLLPSGLVMYSLGLAMTAFGLAMTVWARVHLGTNWSASIAQSQQHELVRSGPYAWVRHPIYSGLLLAFWGAFVTRGDLSALLGSALMTYAVLRKQWIEEHWMREIFGEAYALYRRDVPALVPRMRAVAHWAG